MKKPPTTPKLRATWREADPALREKISELLRPGTYLRGIGLAASHGYRVPSEDVPRNISDAADEATKIDPRRGALVRTENAIAYREEQAAHARLAGLEANGWIYIDRDAELAQAAADRAAQDVAREAEIARRVAALEAAEAADRHAARVAAVRMQLEAK